MYKHAGLIFGISWVIACAEPLPENKLDYAGAWQSEEIELLILTDGRVAYQRSENNWSSSVEGPIKEFVGDDFVVGFWFFTTTFEVSNPPHQVNTEWRMTVDGVDLVRVN